MKKLMFNQIEDAFNKIKQRKEYFRNFKNIKRITITAPEGKLYVSPFKHVSKTFKIIPGNEHLYTLIDEDKREAIEAERKGNFSRMMQIFNPTEANRLDELKNKLESETYE